MCTVKQSPGKFEGETCITHLAYAWAMDGFGEDDWTGQEGGAPLVTTFRGPFAIEEIRDADVPLCAECIADVLNAYKITFWEDSQGFAYSTLE